MGSLFTNAVKFRCLLLLFSIFQYPHRTSSQLFSSAADQLADSSLPLFYNTTNRPNRKLRTEHNNPKYRIYTLPKKDSSLRCRKSGICDGNYSCEPDGLGCVRSAEARRRKVVEAMQWSWEAYRRSAWGYDELKPWSEEPNTWFSLGLTIVDSLDTLLIMGLQKEYRQARRWIARYLNFNQPTTVSVFEVTIRILGGLMAAYYQTKDHMYLDLSNQLARRLMTAFDSSTGLPSGEVSLRPGGWTNYYLGGTTNLAEVGSLSLEFGATSRATGLKAYENAVMGILEGLNNMYDYDGLMCQNVYVRSDGPECSDQFFSMGAASDSAYEYLLKHWIITGFQCKLCHDMYVKSMRGMRKWLVRHIENERCGPLTFLSDMSRHTDYRAWAKMRRNTPPPPADGPQTEDDTDVEMDGMMGLNLDGTVRVMGTPEPLLQLRGDWTRSSQVTAGNTSRGGTTARRGEAVNQAGSTGGATGVSSAGGAAGGTAMSGTTLGAVVDGSTTTGGVVDSGASDGVTVGSGTTKGGTADSGTAAGVTVGSSTTKDRAADSGTAAGVTVRSGTTNGGTADSRTTVVDSPGAVVRATAGGSVGGGTTAGDSSNSNTAQGAATGSTTAGTPADKPTPTLTSSGSTQAQQDLSKVTASSGATSATSTRERDAQRDSQRYLDSTDNDELAELDAQVDRQPGQPSVVTRSAVDAQDVSVGSLRHQESTSGQQQVSKELMAKGRTIDGSVLSQNAGLDSTYSEDLGQELESAYNDQGEKNKQSVEGASNDKGGMSDKRGEGTAKVVNRRMLLGDEGSTHDVLGAGRRGLLETGTDPERVAAAAEAISRLHSEALRRGAFSESEYPRSHSGSGDASNGHFLAGHNTPVTLVGSAQSRVEGAGGHGAGEGGRKGSSTQTGAAWTRRSGMNLGGDVTGDGDSFITRVSGTNPSQTTTNTVGDGVGNFAGDAQGGVGNGVGAGWEQGADGDGAMALEILDTRSSIGTISVGSQHAKHARSPPVKVARRKTKQKDPIGSMPAMLDNDDKMHHLACFVPGMLALGHMWGLNTAEHPDKEDDDLLLAAKLMRACYNMYLASGTGVGVEELSFSGATQPEPPPQPHYLAKAPASKEPAATKGAQSTATNIPGNLDSASKDPLHVASASTDVDKESRRRGATDASQSSRGAAGSIRIINLPPLAASSSSSSASSSSASSGASTDTSSSQTSSSSVQTSSSSVQASSSRDAAAGSNQAKPAGVGTNTDASSSTGGTRSAPPHVQRQSGATNSNTATRRLSSARDKGESERLPVTPAQDEVVLNDGAESERSKDRRAGRVGAERESSQDKVTTESGAESERSDNSSAGKGGAERESSQDKVTPEMRRRLKGFVPKYKVIQDMKRAKLERMGVLTNDTECFAAMDDMSLLASGRGNNLRPEFVESLMLMYRATGDPIYQEWGWNIFRAFEKFSKMPNGGYNVLLDSVEVPPLPGDKMESFWTAETLKYFYLLFSPLDVVPLEQYVFNTEAHPLAIWGGAAEPPLKGAHARGGLFSIPAGFGHKQQQSDSDS